METVDFLRSLNPLIFDKSKMWKSICKLTETNWKKNISTNVFQLFRQSQCQVLIVLCRSHYNPTEQKWCF